MRLISFWPHEIVEPKIAVSPPKKTIRFKVKGAHSKIKELLIIKKIPAVTKVAAWIKADTGVGPSIA